MEKTLERQLEEICSAPEVTGVLCADKFGLTIGTRGKVLLVRESGVVSSLAQQAAALHPDAAAPPVICLEADSGITLIRNQDPVTLAIFKERPSS